MSESIGVDVFGFAGSSRPTRIPRFSLMSREGTGDTGSAEVSRRRLLVLCRPDDGEASDDGDAGADFFRLLSCARVGEVALTGLFVPTGGASFAAGAFCFSVCAPAVSPTSTSIDSCRQSVKVPSACERPQCGGGGLSCILVMRAWSHAHT